MTDSKITQFPPTVKIVRKIPNRIKHKTKIMFLMTDSKIAYFPPKVKIVRKFLNSIKHNIHYHANRLLKRIGRKVM